MSNLYPYSEAIAGKVIPFFPPTRESAPKILALLNMPPNLMERQHGGRFDRDRGNRRKRAVTFLFCNNELVWSFSLVARVFNVSTSFPGDVVESFGFVTKLQSMRANAAQAIKDGKVAAVDVKVCAVHECFFTAEQMALKLCRAVKDVEDALISTGRRVGSDVTHTPFAFSWSICDHIADMLGEPRPFGHRTCDRFDVKPVHGIYDAATREGMFVDYSNHERRRARYRAKTTC